jgi:hypothetical protein
MADTDPAGVGGKIIDTVGHCPSQSLDEEVVNPHLFRVALRPPFPAAVLEIADQFLLLGINRDDRLLGFERGLRQSIDVSKLRIPIRMAIALSGLAVGLQAEMQRLQQLADDCVADLVPLSAQFRRKPPQAARPSQARLRIAPLTRLDQLQQRGDKACIVINQRLAPSSRAPNPPWSRS